VLVVIYRIDAPKGVAQALLIERADHVGFWQSVTGSLDSLDEALLATCQREVQEETGLHAAHTSFEDLEITHTYAIYPHWAKRYAPGVLKNTEHVFALKVPFTSQITLAPNEHTRFQWLPLPQAAMTCFSWTNAQAIEALIVKLQTA
jgi:dihydroneopterin triphosphate diphosphatase